MSLPQSFDESRSLITFRPVKNSEHEKVIELWQTAFDPKGDGYFERYLSPIASPNYQDGDTLGAWSNANNQLVSVVHIRRVILRSSYNETFVCGIISNVATAPDF